VTILLFFPALVCWRLSESFLVGFLKVLVEPSLWSTPASTSILVICLLTFVSPLLCLSDFSCSIFPLPSFFVSCPFRRAKPGRLPSSSSRVFHVVKPLFSFQFCSLLFPSAFCTGSVGGFVFFFSDPFSRCLFLGGASSFDHLRYDISRLLPEIVSFANLYSPRRIPIFLFFDTRHILGCLF